MLSSVGIFIEQYCRPLFLSVSPFVGGLEQQIPRTDKQLLPRVTVGIPERPILLTLVPGLFHFVVRLLYRTPAVLYAELLHCIARKFLYMKTVDYASGIREGWTDYPPA